MRKFKLPIDKQVNFLLNLSNSDNAFTPSSPI